MMDFVEMATVTSQDPANFAVYVLIDRLGAQGPMLPVQVLTPGPRDGTTIKARDGLPTRGTRGLVAFPRRDPRNGHWLGATSAGLLSANSLVPGQGGAGYAAHYPGGYSAMADDGTLVEGLPDGSVIQIGPTTVTPSRRTLAANQGQQVSPFPEGQRVAQAPAEAFPVSMTLASGISVSGTSAGALTLTAKTGQSITFVVGGTTFTLSGGGEMATISTGSAQVVLNGASGEVQITNGTVTALINGAVMVVTKGGSPSPVRLANGAASSVLSADA